MGDRPISRRKAESLILSTSCFSCCFDEPAIRRILRCCVDFLDKTPRFFHPMDGHRRWRPCSTKTWSIQRGHSRRSATRGIRHQVSPWAISGSRRITAVERMFCLRTPAGGRPAMDREVVSLNAIAGRFAAGASPAVARLTGVHLPTPSPNLGKWRLCLCENAIPVAGLGICR